MNEIVVKGQTYQIGKLSALAQFHVSRRLGPMLATMGISLATLKAGAKLHLEDFLPLLAPLSEIMAAMTDDDVNYILFTCLDVVKRKQGKGWARITNSGTMMFEDIEMPEMLRLVVQVLQDNLGNFIPGPSDEQSSASSSEPQSPEV